MSKLKSASTATFYQQQLDRIEQDESLQPQHYLQIRQSRAFMQQAYFEKLALNDLANSAYMSRFHYVRKFQQVYGLTPKNYLRDLRIEKAKQLIVQGYPVTEVCLAVGYESLPTFSAVFKKCTGFSPSQYQRLHKSNLE
ncbi:helix-turn-helix transcriptional regulator [Shewanella sp. Scap07]|uniref:helix-turn-helix transcriptional regulator n=1 Tax=Shewanella sp. Scap07 TaxID=2589987 RepID=UPI0015BBC2C6|nr:helix-turn-helix transcriptional regulator [Shewanella sp. Scap07]QLE85071.1 helix-turn-helix transcriptional regulator [Shewanella sp. Scap07]